MDTTIAVLPTLEEFDAFAQHLISIQTDEDVMESEEQALARHTTLGYGDALNADSEFRVTMHSELGIAYLNDQGEKRCITPDNFLRRTREDLVSTSSFIWNLERVKPFWAFEYVSPSSRRKDYETNRPIYEFEFKISYLLLFDLRTRNLVCYHHNGTCYDEMRINMNGRYDVPELHTEVGVHRGWLRYWIRGKLVPLPNEVHVKLRAAEQQAKDQRTRADSAESIAKREKERADNLQEELQRVLAAIARQK